jgi:restriction endonuclease S subunit
MKRNELATIKLFVEFYLPQYQSLLDALKRSPYPLVPLRDISVRMFDGPFGSNRKVDMYQDSGIPYVRVKDVLPEGINVKGLTYISEEKHQEIIRSRVVPGNVLITIAGRVGTVAVFPDSFPEGNITGHIAGVEVPNAINPYYLAAFLNSWLGEFQIKRWSHRTTRPELNLRELEQVLISVPPRPVQDQIAQLMRDAYAVRQKARIEARELLDNIDRFVTQQLGIHADWLSQERRFVRPVSRLGRWDITYSLPYFYDLENAVCSGRYPVRSFGELVEFSDEITDPLQLPDEIFRYIEIGGIDSALWEVNSYKEILGREAPSRARRLVREGDVVTGVSGVLTGTKGQASFIVPPHLDGAVASTGFAVLRPHEGILAEYIFSLLVSGFFLEMIWRRKTGAAIPAISDRDFKAIPTPYAPLDVQEKIASAVMNLKKQAMLLHAKVESDVKDSKELVEQMILGQDSITKRSHSY